MRLSKDQRKVLGLAAIGIAVLVVFDMFVVPAVRAAALENAPVAATSLSVAIDIFLPLGAIVAFLNRRGLSAPVLWNKMFPVWVLCVFGAAIIYFDGKYLVPATTRLFTDLLVAFIGTSNWVTPFLYWGVWLLVLSVALLNVGLSAGYSAGTVKRSFQRGLS